MENNVIKDLVPVEFANVRVLTTKQLAEFYGTTPTHLRDNFRHNKKRFTEGVDFFKLEGEELRTLKEQVEERITSAEEAEDFRSQGGYKSPLAGATGSLVLYTKQGAARHCKMLSTQKAWEVFNLLMDNYFASTSVPQVEEPPEPAWKNKFLKPAPVVTTSSALDVKEEIELLKKQFTLLTSAELAVVYVLLMSNGTVKIGMTQNLTERIKQLKYEKGLDTFKLYSSSFMLRDDAAKLEKALHEKYAPLRWRGEFYKARFVDVVADIKALA